MLFNYFLFVQLWPTSWFHNTTYFTIHGIWPQDFNGSWPQYCNSTQFNVTMVDPIKQNLTTFWTDFKNPEAFWQHEFQKHLSCTVTPYKFFWYGLEFREKLNVYDTLNSAGITPGSKYKVDDLANVIRKQFGSHVVITCERDILSEVRFCMDLSLQLFDCPNNEYKEGCQNMDVWY